MGLFDFFKKEKPEPRTIFIEGIGSFFYKKDYGHHFFYREVNLGFGYETRITFHIVNQEDNITPYQISYFKALKGYLETILADATMRLQVVNSKETLLIRDIAISDEFDNSYDSDADIVLFHKKKNAFLYPSGITSIIIKDFKIDEILQIE